MGAPMKRFVIHTENKDLKYIENLLSIGFDGFTVVKGVGFWKGAPEKTLEIIIYTRNTELVRAMAQNIKSHNHQEAVLISESACDINLV